MYVWSHMSDIHTSLCVVFSPAPCSALDALLLCVVKHEDIYLEAKLTNNTPDPRVFKIKATSPELYAVRSRLFMLVAVFSACRWVPYLVALLCIQPTTGNRQIRGE